MTKVAFFGDFHANTRYAVNAVKYAVNAGAEKLFHLGDFGYLFEDSFIHPLHDVLKDRDVELWFIEGNHDSALFLNSLERFNGPRSLGIVTDRIFHIPRGMRWTEGDVTFMGLGGGVSIDREYRVLNESYWKEEEITDEDVAHALSSTEPVDILLTHDSPFGSSCLPHPYPLPAHIQWDCDRSRDKVLQVVDGVQPHLLYHGHMHHYYQRNLPLSSGHTVEVTGLDCDGAQWNHNMALLDLNTVSQMVRTEVTDHAH